MDLMPNDFASLSSSNVPQLPGRSRIRKCKEVEDFQYRAAACLYRRLFHSYLLGYLDDGAFYRVQSTPKNVTPLTFQLAG